MEKVVNIKANYHIAKVSIFDIVQILELRKWRDRKMVYNHLTSEKNNEVKEYWMSIMKNHSNCKKYHNLVPLQIRSLYALQATWSTVSTWFETNIVALGTDFTPPTVNDTQLGNEILRSTFTNRYTIEETAYFDKFYSTAEVSWNTFLEVWLFVDGDEMTPNSGILMSRVNMDEEIWPNETLSINATISFNI